VTVKKNDDKNVWKWASECNKKGQVTVKGRTAKVILEKWQRNEMHTPRNSNLAMSLQISSSDGWRLWAEPENMIIEEHEVCQRHHSSCWSRRRVSGLKFLARWWMKREMLCFFRYISGRGTIIKSQMKCKDELGRDGPSTGPRRVAIPFR
jgi:hypothetical protein